MSIIKIIKMIMILFITMNLLGCGSVGNPTAKEILKANSNADIIQFENIIYSKSTVDKSENEYTLGKKIGEVRKKTSRASTYKNLYASKLPKGTELFSSDKDYKSGDSLYVILIKINDEVIAYNALIEG